MASLVRRYFDLSEEYNFSAELLLNAYKVVGVNPNELQKTKPLFMLIGHSCECCLKACIVHFKKLGEKELKKYSHDLIKLYNDLHGQINEDMQELVFYLASNHYANDGNKTSYALRYDDNQFDGDEEKKRRRALLEKQKTHGFPSDRPIYIGQATDEQKTKLEPELSNYSRYLFSTTKMIPKPDFAITTIRQQLNILKAKEET